MDVSYLRRDATGLPGTIAMMSAPGQARTLAADLDELASKHGCVALVSLTSDNELHFLRIADLAERTVERGIRLIRFPIAPFSTPDSFDGVASLTAEILEIARGGAMVAIHCWAGLGRTGLVSACCLVALGLDPEQAIAAVRQCRPRTIETSDQEEFVVLFARGLAAAEPRGSEGAQRLTPGSPKP